LTQNNSDLQLHHKVGKKKWTGQGTARWQRVCLNIYSVIENIFPLFISTQSVAFSFTDFYTTLYFVNQRNYKTLAMLAHTLTHTRNFYSLNVIISHPIVYKEGLDISPYVLSLCSLLLTPICVFVTVIQAQSYVVSTAQEEPSNNYITITFNQLNIKRNFTQQ
jgi:hypothetical protein